MVGRFDRTPLHAAGTIGDCAPNSIMDMPNTEQEFTAGAVRSQLDRILGHEEFRATAKMRDFLRFVVEETLAGRAQTLKGFTIAVEVFGRGEDFDAAHDPVVRIQAGRLRRALERYYLVAGGQDPILIDIPKGSYVPLFSAGPASPAVPPATDDTAGAGSGLARRVDYWPSVLILPFEDLTGDNDLAHLGAGLATELCIELGRCHDLRVMLFREVIAGMNDSGPRPDFSIHGSIRKDASTLKVVVQLVETATGEQVWADSLKARLGSGELITFQERIANRIATYVAGQHGAIFQALSTSASRHAQGDGTTYEALLKGYAYHQSIDPESYARAFEALTYAYARNPACGLVCTMLAVLYVDNIAFEFFDPQRTPIDEALRLAQEGARAEPSHQLSLLALARAHFARDELDAALVETEAALALQPDSLLWMDAIGYMLLLLGQWERGEKLVREAIRRNPFYRAFTRYATWYNRFRQQDYAGALEETVWLRGVGDFWYPLCRAATLGQLGLRADCRAEIQDLLRIKPDFRERGRVLIGHYVKFPEIRDRVFEGLAAGGLSLPTS